MTLVAQHDITPYITNAHTRGKKKTGWQCVRFFLKTVSSVSLRLVSYIHLNNYLNKKKKKKLYEKERRKEIQEKTTQQNGGARATAADKITTKQQVWNYPYRK